MHEWSLGVWRRKSGPHCVVRRPRCLLDPAKRGILDDSARPHVATQPAASQLLDRRVVDAYHHVMQAHRTVAGWALGAIVGVALAGILGAALPCDAQQTAERGYACENLFAFGLWGWDTAPYDLGLEGLLRNMRRNSMNCLLAAPRLNLPFGSGHAEETPAERIARLGNEVALCGRYGVSAMVYVGVTDASEDQSRELLPAAADALKDESSVLGWYIRDEPAPEFLPEFLEYQSSLEQAAPRQPALCLFYRPDSAAVFAPHQPLLLTDCYPVAYMHDGTSLGPHFAAGSGPLRLSQDLGRFNMWGPRGVLEWMDLCAALCGDKPHWVTLQVFESGDGRDVRWRQPTATELRLQTYIAVAGGAKGVLYFRYGLLVDPYGAPLPAVHGEQTPLWEEIGRLGAALTPLGPLLLDAEVAEPLTVVTSSRPTADPGRRVEIRRLRSRTRTVDYLIAFNNDVIERRSAQINLDRAFVAGRRLYDLDNLERVPVQELAGAVSFSVEVAPGGGRVFALGSESDYQWQRNTVLHGRCKNSASAMESDYTLAMKSGIALDDVSPLRSEFRGRLAAEDYEGALTTIAQCATRLDDAMRRSDDFEVVRQDLLRVRGHLGRLEAQSDPSHDSLRAEYLRLLGQFRDGGAGAIRRETELLLEQAEAATRASGKADIPE